jgi:hypothetical protein
VTFCLRIHAEVKKLNSVPPYIESTIKYGRGYRSRSFLMGSILPFLPRGVFDDAATKIMGEAFDAARKALDDTGQPPLVQEVMARRIIAAARKGERNFFKLRDAALEALPTNVRAAEG